MVDNTMDEDFINENADRILAWEIIHIGLCAGGHVSPCRIAARIGISTSDIHEIIDSAYVKARKRGFKRSGQIKAIT